MTISTKHCKNKGKIHDIHTRHIVQKQGHGNENEEAGAWENQQPQRRTTNANQNIIQYTIAKENDSLTSKTIKKIKRHQQQQEENPPAARKRKGSSSNHRPPQK